MANVATDKTQKDVVGNKKKTRIIMCLIVIIILSILFVIGSRTIEQKKIDDYLNQEVEVCYRAKVYVDADDGSQKAVVLDEGVCVDELAEDPLPVCKWMDGKGVCHN